MFSFLQVFRPKFVCISYLSHAHYMSHPSHTPWFNHPMNMWWRVHIMKLLIMWVSPASCHFLPLRSKYSPQHPFSNTLNLRSSLIRINFFLGINIRRSTPFSNTLYLCSSFIPIQNGSGVHPASYPMGTRGSFPGGKSAGTWSWPLTSI
jgi:hypothetical protein